MLAKNVSMNSTTEPPMAHENDSKKAVNPHLFLIHLVIVTMMIIKNLKKKDMIMLINNRSWLAFRQVVMGQ